PTHLAVVCGLPLQGDRGGPPAQRPAPPPPTQHRTSQPGPLHPDLLMRSRHTLSRRGESHPPALSDPAVSLSTHPAPVIQPLACAPGLAVGKERWFPSCDGCQEAPCSPGTAAQPFVLPDRPSNEVLVDASEQERDQLRPIEAAVVVDPT